MARNQTENWPWRNYQDSVTVDARDQQQPARKPVCRAGRKAPRGPGASSWDHPDAKEVPYKSNRLGVTMDCPHCGHEWREPR